MEQMHVCYGDKLNGNNLLVSISLVPTCAAKLY